MHDLALYHGMSFVPSKDAHKQLDRMSLHGSTQLLFAKYDVIQRASCAVAGSCYDSTISFSDTSGDENTDPLFPASNAMLNLDNSAWCTTSSASSAYLQVAFGSIKVVCGVAVQGLSDENGDVFATSFKLSFAYTDADQEWAQFYEEDGIEKVGCIL